MTDDYSGGIRYVKSGNALIDFDLSYDDAQNNLTPGYWVDYLMGTLGL